MKVGQILEVAGHIVEVCEVNYLQCTHCIGYNKKSLCKKLPMCAGIYFKKLNSYEIRKAKKAGKSIEKL